MLEPLSDDKAKRGLLDAAAQAHIDGWKRKILLSVRVINNAVW